ncbi:MAG: polyphenol oxidase family protein [Deltaproteobacteria bacterium]|nr:polyphenol oxidase family protein [Deltaproteobacteria bacterium]
MASWTPPPGKTVSADPPLVIQSPLLQHWVPGVAHGFSGALAKSAGVPFNPPAQRLVAGALGIPDPPVLTLEQVHGAAVVNWALENPRPQPDPQADGVLAWPRKSSGQRGFTAVRTADCVPILAACRATSSFAAVHAGWRGAAANILPTLLRRWKHLGSPPGELRLALGPSIGPCCFEVQEDCLSQFPSRNLVNNVRNQGNSRFLDLPGVLYAQARDAGLAQNQIEILRVCTCCKTNPEGHHPYASHRRCTRQGVENPAFNASFIGWAG